MRALVNDEIAAYVILVRGERLPRQHDRALFHGFTAQLAPAAVHDPGFVGVLVTDPEVTRIDDHAVPLAVEIDPQVEDRDAGAHGDEGAHPGGQR